MAGDDEDIRCSFADRPMTLSSRPMSLALNGNEIELPEESVLRFVSTGTMKYPGDDNFYTFSSQNLIDLGVIGNGNFGTVYKMKHIDTTRSIAVKKIRCNNVESRDQVRLLREHDVIVKSENGPNIVRYYGAIFNEGDCWICMELMDVSMDLLYKRVYNINHSRLEENVIGHIAVCTIDALDYLKQELKIIHRDVKPSNILVNSEGDVKLCDFGICGQLENSVAKTHDAGCQPYLAPERIKNPGKKYDVRSDVWSLGITLFEIATGRFPYDRWSTLFDQIAAVVNGDPPLLQNCSDFAFSLCITEFCNRCLTKDSKNRPKYDKLKQLDFYQKYSHGGSEIARARQVLGQEAVDARDHPVEQRG